MGSTNDEDDRDKDDIAAADDDDAATALVMSGGRTVPCAVSRLRAEPRLGVSYRYAVLPWYTVL